MFRDSSQAVFLAARPIIYIGMERERLYTTINRQINVAWTPSNGYIKNLHYDRTGIDSRAPVVCDTKVTGVPRVPERHDELNWIWKWVFIARCNKYKVDADKRTLQSVA